ncbi:hypothetical protein Nmel_018481 [Mimus melanotis]
MSPSSLEGLPVVAGTILVPNLLAAQQDPDIWQHPELFLPVTQGDDVTITCELIAESLIEPAQVLVLLPIPVLVLVVAPVLVLALEQAPVPMPVLLPLLVLVLVLVLVLLLGLVLMLVLVSVQ